VLGCGTGGGGEVAEPSPMAKKSPQKPTVVPVVFVGPEAAPLRVRVEVARTQNERSRGLMFRKTLPSGSGMIFVFEREEEQRFWMKNTLISLDMIFIGSDKRIVGIVHEATPQTLTQRTVGKPSLYVLEVPGGWSRSHGLEVGQHVRFEGIE